MTARRLGPSALAAAVLAALGAAQPDPPPPDPANDPLPPGAKVRFGTSRPVLRANPAVALLPPAFTNFVAPTMAGGVRRYDLGTGRPLRKPAGPGDLVSPGAVV